MKKIIHKLTPAFIRKFDQYLLENHPFLWSKRAAHVLFFGFSLLLFNSLLCAFKTISIFTYTPLWIFIWYTTVPSVLFLLVWLFFQYKYELAWDYAKMGWKHYFKTGWTYVFVVTLCVLQVVIPAGIYQSRLNHFYNASLDIPRNVEDDFSQSISDTYFDSYYSSYEDLEYLDPNGSEYERVKKAILDRLFGQLDNFNDQYDGDTIIKTGVEPMYYSSTILTLEQFGDSMHRYPGSHYWLVKFDSEEELKNPKYLDGELWMFSPAKYYVYNRSFVDQNFDSTDYDFNHFFRKHYMSTSGFPTMRGDHYHNWIDALYDKNYIIEVQNVRFHNKMVTEVINDNRIGKNYDKYVFTTELKQQDTSFQSHFYGVTIRGNNKLFRPHDFYGLKRLENFFYQRYGVESLEHLNHEFVEANVKDVQKFARLINNIERDYGDEFTAIDLEKGLIYMAIIYSISAVLAIILLSLRLLSFKLLVVSALALAITCFIVFVPMAGFNISPFALWPSLLLSAIYVFLISSNLRLFWMKSVSKLMIITMLAAQLALPWITLYYFVYIVESLEYYGLYDKLNITIYAAFVLGLVFNVAHIPYLSASIHRAFYLPKS